MKKLLTGIVTMALVFSISSETAFACCHRKSCIDADYDGYCDYHTSCQYIDADGDGICDNSIKKVSQRKKNTSSRRQYGHHSKSSRHHR